MSAVPSFIPYIVLFSLVAVGIAEAVAYVILKDDRQPGARRAQPE